MQTEPYWSLSGQGWLDGQCEKRLKDRGNYGIRVARPGYDARHCAENQLLFNSGWPILQICKVIDFSKDGEELVLWYSDIEGWTDTKPEGVTQFGNEITTGYEYGTLWANRRYIRKCVNVTMWRKPNPDPNAYPRYISYYRYVYKVKKHYMGFTPAFLPAYMMALGSGNKDAVLLFSIDLETDIDYPYTEKPLAMLKPTRDYGIKSSSIFGKRVPGLSSNQFSKLVQAVKTEKTAVCEVVTPIGDDDIKTKMPSWCAVEKGTSVRSVPAGLLRDYEAFAFGVCEQVTAYLSPSNPGGLVKEPEYAGGDWYRQLPAVVIQGIDLYLNPIFPIDAIYYQPFGFRPGSVGSSIVPKSTVVVLRKPLTASEEVEVRV